MDRNRLNFNSKTFYVIKLLIILLLIIFASALVYLTGGTHRAFTHFMYIPIILSSFFFGTKGAIITSLIGGLNLGPFMPQNVEHQLMQDPYNWTFRIVIFAIIGTFSAMLFNQFKAYKEAEIENSYKNLITGSPNINKLKSDLDDLIDLKTDFSLLGFKIMNIANIRQNISNNISVKAQKKVIKVLSDICNTNVYSAYDDQFAVILPNKDVEEAQILGDVFLDKALNPLRVDGLSIGLLIKGGIVNYPRHGENAYDLVKKMSMILDRKTDEIGIDIYDSKLDDKSKKHTEIVTSLMQAIKNEEFFLHYQPKIGINGNNSKSVEALIRWNHPTRGLVSPATFISIAEETGLIVEITKWVIKEAIQQKEKWKKAGMSITISINISYKDLSNKSTMDYLRKISKDGRLDLSLFELELTERNIPENIGAFLPIFNEIKKSGIKLALDDFGTGYTTLEELFCLPMDYIKIDKSLIDNIDTPTYHLSVKSIIEIAHSLGRRVIAEGVEHKEQLDILRDMNCDYIQGYYMSKPIPADELIDFYSKQDLKV